MRFTVESSGVAKEMCNDFVMLSGKTAEAYHVKSGDRMGKEAHLQYCAGHYGDLDVITVDSNGNEVVEKVAAGKAFWDWNLPGKRYVRRVVLEPGAPYEAQVFNRWDILKKEMCPPDMTATPSDIGIFIQHLMFISDDDAEGVAYFLNWLATLYQHPSVKVPSAIMLFSRNGRMGKSMLHRILAPVFGASMVANCAGHELHKNFMDAIEDKRLVVLNEAARSDKQDSYERFKNMISEPDLQFEGKGRASKRIKNIAHYILTTNNADALPLMSNDGRILVLRCEAERRPDSYYQKLAAWMDGPGPALLAGVLAQWQFPAGWDPYAPVPQTESVRRTQRESRPGVDLFVEDLVERRAAPFDNDHGLAADLVEQMHTLYPGNVRGMNLTRISMGRALKALGAVQVRVDRFKANGTRTTSVPYVWRNADQWVQKGQPSKQLIDWYAENLK